MNKQWRAAFLRWGLIASGLIAVMINSHATVAIPDVPLFMNSAGVKPNFIMTLDDSGSMQWAYAPDSAKAAANTNRFKSAYFNGIYYNPTVQYYAPPKYNRPVASLNCQLSSNASDCYPNATYTAAYINPFDTSRGTPVDLSTNYKAVTVYSPSNITQTFAGSPSGSGDRTYYSSTSGTSTPIEVLCTVTFDSRSGDERIDISNCKNSPANTVFAGFTSTDTGQALTVECLTADGCGSLASKYLTGIDGNGDAIPYTMTYSSSSRVTVGNQAQWLSDASNVAKVRLSWSRPSSTTVAYPGYYYLFFSQAGVSKPSTCSATVASQKTDDNCYVRIWVGSTADSYKSPDGSVATTAQKWQNFANWYSYYRTRNLSLVSGTLAALNGLEGTIRVAWQAINTCTSFSASSCKGWNNPSTGVDNRIRELDQVVTGSDTHRKQLYDWLARFPANGYTPMRPASIRAGQYCDTTVTALSATSPWAENPPNTAGTYYACRRSVHLLMTDGIWNTNAETTTPAVGNVNNSTITLPSGAKLPNGATTWTPGTPYTDSNSNDLADIAMFYWSRDLAPTIGNKLSPLIADRSGAAMAQWLNPKNDPATWQHLTTYAISLGLSSVLVSPSPVWGGSTYSGDYASLLGGSKSWPTTGSDLPGNAYDLWHAAIAGRGQFYSAESSDELKNAFKSVVNSVSTLASSGGGAGLAANSVKVTTTTAVYFASFSGDWSGSFQSIPLQTDGGLGTTSWDASQRIPFAANRNIYTFNGTAQQFSTCSGSLASALNKDLNGSTDNLCSQRLAWLRGFLQVTGASWAASNKKATLTIPGHGLATGNTVVITNVTPLAYNGTYIATAVNGNTLTVDLPLSTDPGSMSTGTVGTARYADFRDRASTVLGDIMNSTPAYSFNDDFGYGSTTVTLGGHTSYGAYVAGKATRKPMVYVGANDGMLHAFNAETLGSNAGKELFAFVPAGVYSNLSKLTSPVYSHKFFVDGPPTVGDVYLGGGWKTYLVGGLGAGGKSVYALDISEASQFGEASFNASTYSPSALVKWEYTDTNLGLTMGQMQIAPNSNSQWAAIFGNGYNSGDDKAYLFVVNMSDGTLISKVAAGTATSNGLATPYLHDSNGDKIPDVAYAGDLKGNLWKFVNTTGIWSLGNGGNPLFTALLGGVAQPVTAAPRVLPHPNGGVMIYFGTGSYLTDADLTNAGTQSIYGVWDDGVNRVTQGRTNLQGQTMTTSGNLRTATATAPNWGTARGCYIDLPSGSPSERILSSPLIKDFSTLQKRVIFTSSQPTADACDRGGTSWLLELSAACGQLTDKVVDTNGDNVIDANDTAVIGIKLPDSIGMTMTNPPLWLDGGTAYPDRGFKYILGSKGVPVKVQQTKDPDPIPAGGSSVPVRVYWKQIF